MSEEIQSTEKSENEQQETPVNETEALKEQVAQLKDQLLRAMAEAENIRKRMEKQIEDTSKFAISGFAKDLINVAENLQRALNSISAEQLENQTVKAIFDGVEMTKKELFSVFDKNKITIIEPKVGDPFDHNYHQAVAHVENNEFGPGIVASVLQNGYMIYDRILRPAMVIVTKG